MGGYGQHLAMSRSLPTAGEAKDLRIRIKHLLVGMYGGSEERLKTELIMNRLESPHQYIMGDRAGSIP